MNRLWTLFHRWRSKRHARITMRTLQAMAEQGWHWSIYWPDGSPLDRLDHHAFTKIDD